MEFLTKMYVKAYEWHKGMPKGQSMTEYALILAAIAVAVWTAYSTLGGQITTKVQEIITDLGGGAA